MARLKQSPDLEQRVARFMREYCLVTSGSCLLLAVSGGADSTCLLHLLTRIKDELGIRLHVAHLDHQLRGAESEADAGYVVGLAHRLGVPVTLGRRDVRAYQKKRRISLEEAAREVRYRFLADTASLVGAGKVAAGHTSNDQVETILMHLVRGSGTRGLRGLQPSTGWQVDGKPITVVRPLLEVSRRETTDYCRSHRLRPRQDTSNLSLSPLRNRIRHRLLPLLESYNPRVAEALLRTSKVATDELAYMDEEVARLWADVVKRQDGVLILDRGRFLQMHPALKRHLLRMAIEELWGNIKDIETSHIEGMLSILDKPAGKQVSLPGGLVFTTEYDRYLLGRQPVALCPFPVLGGEVALKIPGATRLPGWRVRASIIEPGPVPKKDNEFTARFDFDKVGSRLSVRSRRPGDRFQPLGMSQTKKLGEFMIDARIPVSWRRRVPVVCSPRHILWLVGWRIDERVKVTVETKRVLELKFDRG